jgi:hypothetical protein
MTPTSSTWNVRSRFARGTWWYLCFALRKWLKVDEVVGNSAWRQAEKERSDSHGIHAMYKVASSIVIHAETMPSWYIQIVSQKQLHQSNFMQLATVCKEFVSRSAQTKLTNPINNDISHERCPGICLSCSTVGRYSQPSGESLWVQMISFKTVTSSRSMPVL